MAGAQPILPQESLETILAQLPLGLMVIDWRGTILTCNPTAQAILESRYGWRGTDGATLRSLPWEIQTGVKYLSEVARRRDFRHPTPAFTLTSDDPSLHCSLLLPKEGTERSGPESFYVVVVLKGSEPSPSQFWQSRSPLTHKEREVLQWLATGKTRKEISAMLQVTEGTVRTHLEHIYAKLGVTNRIEAVAVALQEQLVQSVMSSLGLS